MNIVKTFANYLQDELGLGTLGQDIFVSRAPGGVGTLNDIWWLVLDQPSSSERTATGEWRQSVGIGVYFRSVNPETVYNSMEILNQDLLATGCITLVGYNVIEPIQTNGPFIDQDIDLEERTVGKLEVILTIYN